MRHAESLEQHASMPLCGPPRLPQHMDRRQPDVLQRRQVRKQVVELEDHADTTLELTHVDVDLRRGHQVKAVDDDGSARERLQAGNRSQHGRLPRPRRAHQRDALAARQAEGHVAQQVYRNALAAFLGVCRNALTAFLVPARLPLQLETDDVQDGHARRHVFSIRRAMRASGRDIARYIAAHIRPGSSQLPMLAAKIDVCLVSSTTVMTETSELSLRSATKSLVIGASARRNACGPLISTSAWRVLKPSVRAASSCPRGTASSAPR